MQTRHIKYQPTNRRIMLPALLLIAAVVAFQQLPAAARQGGGIINVTAPGGMVVIYWDNPNVYAGQILAVVRGNNAVGSLMATEVTAYYVKAKIVSGAAIDGDRVLPPQESPSAMPPLANQPSQPAAKNERPHMARRRVPKAIPIEVRETPKESPAEIPVEIPKTDRKKKEKKADEAEIVLKSEDEKPAQAAPEKTKQTPPPEKSTGKGKVRVPLLQRAVLFAIGGGLYTPTGKALSGESQSAGIEAIVSLPFVRGYDVSAAYNLVTPGFKSSGVSDAQTYEQKITMSRLHLSVATKPRGIFFFPALSVGFGYTMNQFKYNVCAETCSSFSGRSGGPHVLARAKFKFPFSMIAEARYEWDTSTDLDDFKTDGVDFSVLFPINF